MSSSSEEELRELLRHGTIWRPRNFAEKQLFDTESPREFQENFCLSVDAFAHFLELLNLRLENTLA